MVSISDLQTDPAMQASRCIFLSALLAVFLASGIRADGREEETEANRRALDKLKQEPEQLSRLRRELRAFLAHPEERQQQLRRLDRELHEEDSATVARLQRVLERYADWLQRLPETDRQWVAAAPDSKARLERIRKLREDQWIARLPMTVQSELEKLRPDQSAYRAKLDELKQKEHKTRDEWRRILKQPRVPVAILFEAGRLRPFAKEIQEFVRDSLTPLLREDEAVALRQAHADTETKGDWGGYLALVAELADAHPIRFPPGLKRGPSKFEELPPEWQARLRVAGWPSAEGRRAEGKWPDYALAAVEFLKRSSRSMSGLPPLGPSRPEDFTRAVREFYRDKLIAAMTPPELQNLTKAKGQWPEYPRLLASCAANHGLLIPGVHLPGPPAAWESIRQRRPADPVVQPSVPDRELRTFMYKELTEEERSQLPSLSLADPATRQYLERLYLDRHKTELQRLRQMDRKKQLRKPR